MAGSAEVTALLHRMCAGDEVAADELLPLVYSELHALARRRMAGERNDHTLQATALVNEAWIRLVESPAKAWEGRGHFVRLAAVAMRNVLVQHARRRATRKREGVVAPLPIDELVAEIEEEQVDLLALDEALSRLAQRDEELARLVELRFFAGLTIDETAGVLERTPRQVKRSWATARAWLNRELARDGTE